MALASKKWVKTLLSRLNIGKYSTDEIRVGTWIDGKPLYRNVMNESEIKGIIPICTSNNENIIYSDQFSDDYAWKAFDGDDTTIWRANSVDGFIGYRFDNATKVGCAEIRTCAYSNEVRTASITIQGSNDGTTWVDIKNLTKGVDFSASEEQTIRVLFDEVTLYTQYRLKCAGDSYNSGISSFQLYSTNIDENNTNVIHSDNVSYNGTNYVIREYTKTTD